jgi:hypothetical protein
MGDSMNIRKIAITGAAALALVAGGTAAGAAAFASSATVYTGCVEGTSRTLEHVYTRSNPPPCPSGDLKATWNAVGQQGPPGPVGQQGPPGPQGPSGVVSMAQYGLTLPAAVTGDAWQFLGTPPAESFTDANTAAQVTGTIDLETSDGNFSSTNLGICYEPVGGSTLTLAGGFIEPDFAAPAGSFFAQTVSGVIGNLTPGQYNVGLCANSESANTRNGFGNVSILMAETAAGVSSTSLHPGAARQNQPNQ